MRKLWPALSFPLLIATYVACSDDDPAAAPVTPAASSDASTATDSASAEDTSTAPDAAPRTVSLRFEGRVGAEKFACGSTYTNVGTTHATVTAGDLRLFVSSIRFSLGGGAETTMNLEDRSPWQGSQVGLVDLENKTGECEFGTSATNDVLTGTLPAGTYDTITFEVGVPDTMNHVNVETSGAPFVASTLQWDWANGFIHFASQLNSTATTVDDNGVAVRVPSFYSHFGSTECAGGNPAEGGVSACARKNRPLIKLSAFDPAKDKIVIDLAKLLETSDVDVNTAGTIPGCMSGPDDPECPNVYTQVGLDFTTGAPRGTQSVFSVAPR